MVLTDRKRLAKLMTIQGVSGRQLAAAAGYRSHTYIQRLLRGEVRTLDVDPAVRIALYLGVGVDDLFMPRTDSDAGRSVQRTRTRSAA